MFVVNKIPFGDTYLLELLRAAADVVEFYYKLLEICSDQEYIIELGDVGDRIRIIHSFDRQPVSEIDKYFEHSMPPRFRAVWRSPPVK